MHERHQVLAAPLVANPAGDADGQPGLQVVIQFIGLPREAVRHACRQS